MRRVLMIAALVALAVRTGAAASDHYGQVTFTGLPVPGATVTATLGTREVVTSTDQQGIYRLADLADGTWTVRVEMFGFAPVSRELAIPAESAPATWELTLIPFDDLKGGLTIAPAVRPQASLPSSPAAGGFQRAAPGAVPARAPAARVDPNPSGDDPPRDPFGAADGFLINGSVNNGAASPFAQLRAFGNNRPGQRSLYNGGVGVLAGNSAWDARQYSFAGQPAPKPAYTDVHVIGTFGGPLRIPRLVRNGGNLFVGFQRTADHNATTQSALVPTMAERVGVLPGLIVDPGRISPQAAALLGYYPQPNLEAGGRYNFQAPIIAASRQENVQARLTRPLNMRDQVFGAFAYQRNTTDTTNLFGFEDSNRVSGIDASANWSHRYSQFLSMRLRYQYTRLVTSTTPYFANRTNVAGEAGIGGNNQEPVNWGPPSLVFSSGILGLSDALHAFNRTQTNALSSETFWNHGRHNVTIGADIRRQHVDIQSQQDPRGTFSFTGAVTGSDFADFLLGIPSTSSIAFGNADKFLRAWFYDAYVSDDWRVSPSLTVNAGIRWEYEAPMTERLGRLVNLEIAPGFTGTRPVVSSDGSLRPDTSGIQPRIGAAWRPVAGSSLVVRAGYGVYRNTSVYQSIAVQLAQQPPLSTTLSVENSPANPLTLARGFNATPGSASNTFAVDPNFRVGFAQNWQISIQRDLPASLTVITTYLGTHGSRLMREFLPNTYPSGVANPCPACPAGFVYLTSDGESSRHAGQVQLRRRLRNGLTASVQYTLARAEDDAAAFEGATGNSASIAQDWLDLDAEQARSTFDQRHQVTAQFEYTTGVGVAGGALVSGVKGSLLKGWTITSQLTAGSGLPLTPIYLAAVRGTGITGTIRADLTGAPVDAIPAGYYLNPAAYAAPAAGSWGHAGRNSMTGPAQFSLNTGLGRTFARGSRFNIDWRIDATNVLNRVTYSGVNTIVGSPQFGLPNRTNTMRKLQSSLRVRF